MRNTAFTFFPSTVFLALVLSLPLTTAGFEGTHSPPDVVQVADLLFPDSRDLPLYRDYPSATSTELQSAKQLLKATLKAQSGPESDECSLIDRALEQDDLSSFRKIDLNADRLPDLVYSGSAHCAEGDSTVIWLATQGGYQLYTPAVRPMLLVRLRPDGKQMSSVSRGCCGAPTDEYHLGTLVNFRNKSSVPILQDTLLPPQAASSVRTFVTPEVTRLRSNPAMANTYDQDRSAFLGHAVFGNALRTYMAGARGKSMATIRVQSKDWLFVVMDQESDYRVLADPYRGVRAGWIPARHVRFTGK